MEKPLTFDRKFLEITHNNNYVNQVEKFFPKKGLVFLDGDTIVSPGSKQAALDAVGSIIVAIDGVQNKEFQNAFCAVRPPGHHAEKNKAMGFCIYNNIAVGAYYLLEKYKLSKVAILILMFTTEMEHKISSLTMKMFYIFLPINIHFILVQAQKTRKENLIIFSTFLCLLEQILKNI